MNDRPLVTLEDKYILRKGRLCLNGTQALVRLLLMQKWRDEALGHHTAGFVSGYRGSPLAGLDQALWQAKLDPTQILFQPGLNEELGATAVWGTQQVGLFPGATVQGVFGMWYGKGPGVDRSGDVFKHANAAGTAPLGGVLLLAGDDHLCKSSSLPHQSEIALIDAFIPILHPSSVQDIMEFGLFGWAASRYSGCWVGLKLTGDVVDTTVVLESPDFLQPYILPKGDVPHGHIRWPDAPLDQEKRLHTLKLPALKAFAYVNQIDRLVLKSAKPTLTIVTTGKAYQDVRQALKNLGIDEKKARSLGLQVYKVGLVWPLEEQRLKEVTKGSALILVVEEKRPLLEGQIKEILYAEKERIPVIGKLDEADRPLLPSIYELNPQQVVQAIFHALALVSKADKTLKEKAMLPEPLRAQEASLKRVPYYCSGCPHNTSTRTVDGSRTVAGIGCHYMAMWIDNATATFSQMGGEGVSWIGQAPFTQTPHIFANMGDGTYFHSGSLALRATVAAGVNITYKILYNDAVAMTGGQPVDGTLSVMDISWQAHAEGVAAIAVVTDDLDKYPIGARFAPKTTLHHRREMETVQKNLRAIPGVTVLIYDQACAAEKRRRRKRKTLADPAKRVFINDLVCEGCGDCGRASNCLSVVPKETPFGRKREIDQASCNKDFSCIEGFCPSFIMVEGGKYKPLQKNLRDEKPLSLPEPALKPLKDTCSIVVAGIGGTGVVTIGALLAMSAHLEGKGCTVLDMTGLSQKGGAVMSHVKIGPTAEGMMAARISSHQADLILGADVLVTAMPEVASTIEKGKTQIILNTHAISTGEFAKNPEQNIPVAELRAHLERQAGTENVFAEDLSTLTDYLVGDRIATNIMMLGYAYQKGLIPVSSQSIEEAIRLNKSGMEQNLAAFRQGRRAAHDLLWVASLLQRSQMREETFEGLKERRRAFLTDYQNTTYAAKFVNVIDQVRSFEQKLPQNSEKLAKAVAKYYFKVLAYKDEYEVARLFTQTDFITSVKQQFEGDTKVSFFLAPPLFAGRDPQTGHLRKKKYGPWMLKAFKWVAKGKALRGTPLDPFGYTKERRQERQLIRDYEKVIADILAISPQKMTPAQYELAIRLAAFPETIRGYGHVKEKSFEETYRQLEQWQEEWRKLRT